MLGFRGCVSQVGRGGVLAGTDGCVGRVQRELFVCAGQHPGSGQALPTQLSTTSMQLNARLLTKKLPIMAPQNSFKHRVNSWSFPFVHPLPLPVIVIGYSHLVPFPWDDSCFR